MPLIFDGMSVAFLLLSGCPDSYRDIEAFTEDLGIGLLYHKSTSMSKMVI
ncbi:MAG: hypothetical protein V4651_08030 [Bacteroidota bacterium]